MTKFHVEHIPAPPGGVTEVTDIEQVTAPLTVIDPDWIAHQALARPAVIAQIAKNMREYNVILAQYIDRMKQREAPPDGPTTGR